MDKMETAEAELAIYDSGTQRWGRGRRTLLYETSAFSGGEVRDAYRAWNHQTDGRAPNLMVLKMARSPDLQNELLAGTQVMMQAKCAQYAESFNAKTYSPKKVTYVPCGLVKFLSGRWGGRFGCLENYVKENFVVYNTASNDYDSVATMNTLHAFSHYTFETTNKTEVVVDARLAGVAYADPQLYCVNDSQSAPPYSPAKWANAGVANFPREHECNTVCRGLGLAPIRIAMGTSPMSATTDMPRNKTQPSSYNPHYETEYDAAAGGSFPGHMQGIGQTHGQGFGQIHGQSHGQGYRPGGERYGRSQAGYQGYQEETQGGGHGRQDQMQGQIFREAQASKQMVYEVYGNCITMLEEMENRELKKSGNEALPRSDIYLPDQSKFDDETIQRKLDTQLILLQAQLTSCHGAIKDEVKDELKESTLNWSSEREERKVPNGMTDEYAQKLFGLLETGKTNHPREFNEPPTIDERGMQKALGAIMQGNQKRAELDQAFRDDRDKKATGPKMRQTAGIDKGADRIVKGKPQYEHAVNNHRSSWR